MLSRLLCCNSGLILMTDLHHVLDCKEVSRFSFHRFGGSEKKNSNSKAPAAAHSARMATRFTAVPKAKFAERIIFKLRPTKSNLGCCTDKWKAAFQVLHKSNDLRFAEAWGSLHLSNFCLINPFVACLP